MSITGLKEMGNSAIYLVNALVMGRNMAKEFGIMKNRVQKKHKGWNNQLLSKARNAVLIKSVVQAIPTYTMSTFRIPRKVCKEMDSAIKRFWWSSNNKSGCYLALKAWGDICQPKDQGGLDFRLFNDYNLALLSKLAWKMGSGEEALWSRMLRSKYLKGHTFFEHKIPRGASKVWRSIIEARQLILKGACFKIGNGFGVQPWVPGAPQGIPRLKQGINKDLWRRVAHQRLEGSLEWNGPLINSIVIEKDAKAILNITKPPFGWEDKLIWKGYNNGKFTVKDCFLANFAEERGGDLTEWWPKLWRLELHDRIKLFMGRMMAGVLPTKEILSQRIGSIDGSCVICGQHAESLLHLFKEC